jgi:hypothetical protein
MRQLLTAAVVLFAVACAHPAETHVTLAATPSAPATTSEPVVMCETPKHRFTFVEHREMDDVLTMQCDRFRHYFDSSVGLGCDERLPGIYRVLMEGRDERERALAAVPLAPSSCVQAFPQELKGVDTGRPVDEVDPRWRDCAPYVPDLAGAPHLYVSVGLHVFAMGLWRHLTPIGRQYLRKYVVCEALAATAERDPAVRAAYADVLVTPERKEQR